MTEPGPAAPALAAPRASGPSARAVLRIVLVAVAVGIALYLVYRLRKPITWIVIAAFIAIAVSAPIRWLQRYMRRGLAIAAVYIGVILVPILVAAVLVPPLVTEANDLAEGVPNYVRDLRGFVQDNGTLRTIEEDYDITGKLEEEAAKLPARLGGAAGVLGDIGLGIVNSLFAGITILILSIFMVGSGGRWFEAALARRPGREHAMLRRTGDRISAAVTGYVAGALGQAVVAGVTAWIVLSILGVPYAPALALIMGLLDLVPLVGATLGAIVVGVVTLFSDFPTATIVWAIWSVIYQQVENTVIQPRIQARAVQVQPFVVLVAVLFGSTLFGILGALLAIPFAAAMQVSFREWEAYRAAVRLDAVAAGDHPPGGAPGGPQPIVPAPG